MLHKPTLDLRGGKDCKNENLGIAQDIHMYVYVCVFSDVFFTFWECSGVRSREPRARVMEKQQTN